MPLSDEYKCVFVHIPKTAGSSIETILGLHGKVVVENRKTLFGRIQSLDLIEKGFASHYLQHLTASEVKQILPPEARSWFSFAFVRNPFDRLVSVYQYLDRDMQAKARSVGLELGGKSFPEFVRAVIDLDHVHLLDQHKFVLDESGRLQVDFVGRFEDLASDWGRVCDSIGLQNVELPLTNSAERKAHYSSFYDAKTVRVVRERYRRDLELFDYDFERPRSWRPRRVSSSSAISRFWQSSRVSSYESTRHLMSDLPHVLKEGFLGYRRRTDTDSAS